MKTTYAVIFNPRKLLLKHEVWAKGQGIGMDQRGYAVDVEIKKNVESFTTAKRAEGYIKYQQNVEAFVGV